MDNITKLYSDINRIKKHNRDSNGKLNIYSCVDSIKDLFIKNNKDFLSLPNSLADYWATKYVNSYIDNNLDDENALNDIPLEIIDKLCAMQAFLDNDLSNLNDNLYNVLSKADYKEIANFVNYEAEDLPIELLSSMMSFLVEKNAI